MTDETTQKEILMANARFYMALADGHSSCFTRTAGEYSPAHLAHVAELTEGGKPVSHFKSAMA